MVHGLDPNSFYALNSACACGSYTNVKLLLHYGADSNLENQNTGNTPLMSTIEAYFNLKLSVYDMLDPIFIALLEAGADINACNKEGNSAVEYARDICGDELTDELINFAVKKNEEHIKSDETAGLRDCLLQ